ncbi:MAG: sigma-70 family RNA polymerase sigma factor [Chloroflexi bacterium]|nr:sigma-70 family RNA polymerase sigma factor [Chloroflexota bacterium]
MANDPDEVIPTRGTLLNRLKDWGDQESWREFFSTYWKLIYGVAVRAGLTEAEAQDVVQETIVSVAKTMPSFKYDPATCSFKTWLQHLTRKRIVDQFRKRSPADAADQRHAAVEALEQSPDGSSRDLERIWEEEWQANLLEAALNKIKARVNSKQYQMFYLYVIKKLTIREVARTLEVNAGQVYLAKHRISALVRAEVQKLERELI